MVCIYCSGHLTVSSVWFRKKKNYQYSYICFCINEKCEQYLVKFQKNCKRNLEINTCKNFDLTKQDQLINYKKI